jgi:hypothetical protein
MMFTRDIHVNHPCEPFVVPEGVCQIDFAIGSNESADMNVYQITESIHNDLLPGFALSRTDRIF